MMNLLCLVLLFVSLPNNAYAKEHVYIFARPGDNVTIMCWLERNTSSAFDESAKRIKLTKVEAGDEIEVLVSMGLHEVIDDRFQDRLHLEVYDDHATITITNVEMDDFGMYKCDIMNGMDENTAEVEIGMRGVVFPYSPPVGRYNLNFLDAKLICLEQDAVIASFEQLYQAWKGGLNWCNAGWLSDGTVQYPITRPREPCGGRRPDAGLRTYGRQNRSSSFFDVFCFTAGYPGKVYFVEGKLTYDEAARACEEGGAEMAKVSHMFAAWKLEFYDRCDAGWLADGSVRYPISKPRMKCSPAEAAVRFVGFPDKNQQLYGAYCYKVQLGGSPEER